MCFTKSRQFLFPTFASTLPSTERDSWQRQVWTERYDFALDKREHYLSFALMLNAEEKPVLLCFISGKSVHILKKSKWHNGTLLAEKISSFRNWKRIFV